MSNTKGEEKMTKKAQTIADKYKERQDTEVWCYRNGFSDFFLCREAVYYHRTKFSEMVISMYGYRMLTEKDCDELVAFGKKYCNETIDRINVWFVAKENKEMLHEGV